MPTPDHSNGAPCWIDLMTSDTGKAKAFYGELFGWTFETGDQEKYGGYITARKNGKSVAGLMQKQAEQAGFPDVWSTYLRTDDIWQPGEMKGYELAAEAGTAAWHELHTKDYATAVKFYQDVFGWDTDVMSDTPEFRYTTLGAGDAAKAGIMDASGYLPAEVPSNWQIYFAVEDTDVAIANAVAMGAQVIDGPDDTPFGRLATLADPTGAMFKIVAENR